MVSLLARQWVEILPVEQGGVSAVSEDRKVYLQDDEPLLCRTPAAFFKGRDSRATKGLCKVDSSLHTCRQTLV